MKRSYCEYCSATHRDCTCSPRVDSARARIFEEGGRFYTRGQFGGTFGPFATEADALAAILPNEPAQ